MSHTSTLRDLRCTTHPLDAPLHTQITNNQRTYLFTHLYTYCMVQVWNCINDITYFITIFVPFTVFFNWFLCKQITTTTTPTYSKSIYLPTYSVPVLKSSAGFDISSAANARSPTVDSRVRWITSCEDDDEDDDTYLVYEPQKPSSKAGCGLASKQHRH